MHCQHCLNNVSHCKIHATHWSAHADIKLKLNIMQPLEKQYHRLLPCSRTKKWSPDIQGHMHYQNCLNNVRSQQSVCNTMLTLIWSWVLGTNWRGNPPDCCLPPGWWQIYPKCWCKCIVKTVWTMSDLSNLFVTLCWHQFEAVFQTPIGEAIPKIVALLQHHDRYTQYTGVEALSKLSGQCEISEICLEGNTNQCKAEFQAPIVEAMPQIVALLQHNDGYGLTVGAGALSKLSEQCEILATPCKAMLISNWSCVLGTN